MNKILLSIFFCFGFIILMVGQARAEGFDPNNIISDLEILDYSTISSSWSYCKKSKVLLRNRRLIKASWTGQRATAALIPAAATSAGKVLASKSTLPLCNLEIIWIGRIFIPTGPGQLIYSPTL